jgi:ATP synthase protein I
MQTSDARMFRGAAIPTSVAGVGAVLIGLVAAGAKGALAAALASVVVIAFFSVSALVVSWAAKYSAQTMMLAALASYLVKILAVMVLVTSMDRVTIWDTKVFGWTVIALALLWIAAEFRVVMQRRPYIDEPENVLDRSP